MFLIAGLISSAYADLITANGSKAQDRYQLMKELIYNSNHRLLGSAGIGSATTYLTVTGTPTAVVENKFVTLVATNTISFSNPTVTVGNSEKCIFAVGVQADGSFVTKQGNISKYANNLVMPMFDSGTTTIGKVLIESDSDGSFVPNTTSVAAWGSGTVTITNLSNLPVSLDVDIR